MVKKSALQMQQRKVSCSNPNDISADHIIENCFNGVRLVVPNALQTENKNTVSNFLKKPFNIYFMDLASTLKDINEQTVANCGYYSIVDALGRTARDVAKKQSAEQLIANDRNVIKFNKPEITDDTFDGFNDDLFNCLSFKFPWYDDKHKIIGVFGCSIILDRHSLSESLAEIAKLGLLNQSFKVLPGNEIANVYFSKRENQCLHYYVRGKTAKEISQILKLSPRTIEHYLEKIKAKMDVSSKSELIEKVINYYS